MRRAEARKVRMTAIAIRYLYRTDTWSRRKLVDIPERYTEKIGEGSTRKRLKSFVFAGDNAEALNNLGTDLKDAMELFRVSSYTVLLPVTVIHLIRRVDFLARQH